MLIFNPDAYTDLPQRAFASTCNHFASVIGHTNKYSYIFNPNQLAHEFGHSFGCLRDLYYTSRYSETHPETYANLDQYACPKWCSGVPVIPRPNNQVCQTITSESECKNADVFPKCVWQSLGGFCEGLGIDYACNAYSRSFGGDESSCSAAYSGISGIQCEMNSRGLCLFKGESVYGEHFVNIGQQCKLGYGCYQGAEGFYSYSAEPTRNTIMGYMIEMRYDVASYDHLIDLLSKYSDQVYSGTQKTCEQTRTLTRQVNPNLCAVDETRGQVTASNKCTRRNWRGQCTQSKTFFSYTCVKTTTTACSENPSCPTGTKELSSESCEAAAVSMTQKTCEQTRTLTRRIIGENQCGSDETRNVVRPSYRSCSGYFYRRTCRNYEDYSCVKTTQTECSANAACPTGTIEKSSVAC